MHVTDIYAIGRAKRGSSGFRFFRGKAGEAIPPLPAGQNVEGKGVRAIEDVPDADLPAWTRGGDYVVFSCMLHKGTGAPVPEHIVLSYHMQQPNAWLVQAGVCFQGDGARALVQNVIDWERVVAWSGHFQDARLALKRHMMPTFPEVPWAIVWMGDDGEMMYDGQPKMAAQVKAALSTATATDSN